MTDKTKELEADLVKALSPAELEAEIAATRKEMIATINALNARLNPQAKVAEVKQTAQETATDTKTFLTGGGLPQRQSRARNVQVVLGAAALAAVVIVVAVIRKR